MPEARLKIDLTPCESSRIESHGYHPESKTLALKFKGGPCYHYSGFEPEAYKELQEAESIGRFFGARINVRNDDGSLKYPFARLDEEKDERQA